MKGALENRFDIKNKDVGGNKDLEDEVRVLNRIIRRVDGGWEYEADQRHAEIIVRDCGMRSAKVAVTPMSGERSSEGGEALSPEEEREYRGHAARCNYVSHDRPDITYASKEISRFMSKPTFEDKWRMGRMAKYLKGEPRLVQVFRWQRPGERMRVYADADWGGCKRTRKGTLGEIIRVGAHCIKDWSNTQ